MTDYRTQDEAIKETTSHYITAHNDFAVEHGLNEAILFDKLVRLQQYLEGKIDNQGNKWVRMQNTDWKNELPFWSQMTIRRVIESCESAKDNYECLIFSRTFTGRCKWYRVNPTYRKSVTVQNEQLQVFKVNSPNVQNEQLPNSFPTSPPKAAAPPKNPQNKPTQEQLQHKELALKLSTIMGYDKLPIKAVVKDLNTLTKWLVDIGATAADVEQFGRYWWGDKPPSPYQVKNYWAQAMAQKEASKPKSNITPLPGVAEAIARIEAQNG